MIYGFDYDGTLVTSWTSDPLPGARERLARLPARSKTFIATNQAGPVFRAVLGDAKYPTVQEVADHITSGLRALAWRPDVLLICCCAGKDGAAWWRAEAAAAGEFDRMLGQQLGALPVLTFVMAHYRKPQPGMLIAAAQRLGGSELIYVGDMESDRDAAQAAGARYLDVAAWLAAE
jgi:beta-phosphoglucomutase-like phosphatase (HAD superfamily)